MNNAEEKFKEEKELLNYEVDKLEVKKNSAMMPSRWMERYSRLNDAEGKFKEKELRKCEVDKLKRQIWQ